MPALYLSETDVRELLDMEIAGAKGLTAKPFGVNLITMHPQLFDLIAVCARHEVGHVVLAGGIPPKGSVEALKESFRGSAELDDLIKVRAVPLH